IAALERARPKSKFRVDKKDFVGPAVGKHLYRQALLAILLSLAGIVVYVAFRFSNLIWGLAGITALAHDVIVLLGLYSLLGSEMNLVLVAAVLTLAGYSINDTIVIFDRMREKMRVMRKEPLERIINESVNETLSRTFITAFTVFIAVVSLWLWGGSIIRDFAMGMTFGTIIGCYSTIAVASPLVFVFNARPSSAPALAHSGNQEAGRTAENTAQRREKKRKRT
ncbi:MAG: protein translocase subunit SecF, partial [Elusimicrobiota bacterium]